MVGANHEIGRWFQPEVLDDSSYEFGVVSGVNVEHLEAQAITGVSVVFSSGFGHGSGADNGVMYDSVSYFMGEEIPRWSLVFNFLDFNPFLLTRYYWLLQNLFALWNGVPAPCCPLCETAASLFAITTVLSGACRCNIQQPLTSVASVEGASNTDR
ncbi:hypothetical protein GCM10023156_21600 [Novipirellula rosea]|uniref:Uncharacterized protein n=1 Tax=Novipirellula rosea TaxID=1031540 RepID=A0ABP8MPI3_9BACT